MALKDDCKLAMRVVTTAYDSEFDRLIAAAKRDLSGCGVILNDSDDLYKTAVIEYVGSKFKHDEERDKHEKSYREIVSQLRFLSDYKEP